MAGKRLATNFITCLVLMWCGWWLIDCSVVAALVASAALAVAIELEHTQEGEG